MKTIKCKTCNTSFNAEHYFFFKNVLHIFSDCINKISVINTVNNKKKKFLHLFTLKNFKKTISIFKKLLYFFKNKKLEYSLIKKNKKKINQIYLNERFILQSYPFYFELDYLKKKIYTFIHYFGFELETSFIESFYLKKYLNLFFNRTKMINLIHYIDLDLCSIEELNSFLFFIEKNDYQNIYEIIEKNLRQDTIFDNIPNFMFYIKIILMANVEKKKLPELERSIVNYFKNQNKKEYMVKLFNMILIEYSELFSSNFINYISNQCDYYETDGLIKYQKSRKDKIIFKSNIIDTYSLNLSKFKKRFIDETYLNLKKNTHLDKISDIKLNKDNFCIYTCLNGDYDVLKEFNNETDINFYCFTDKEYNNKNWKYIFFNEEKTSFLNSRKPKIMPYNYLKNYKYSLYLDANYYLKDFNHDKLKILEDLLNKNCIFYNHPEVKYLRDEILRIYILKSEYRTSLENIFKNSRYKEFFNEDQMIEASFILRKHDDQNLIKCMNIWWEYVKKYNLRDQVFLNNAIKESKLEFNLIENKYGDSRENFLSIRTSHKN